MYKRYLRTIRGSVKRAFRKEELACATAPVVVDGPAPCVHVRRSSHQLRNKSESTHMRPGFVFRLANLIEKARALLAISVDHADAAGQVKHLQQNAVTGMRQPCGNHAKATPRSMLAMQKLIDLCRNRWP